MFKQCELAVTLSTPPSSIDGQIPWPSELLDATCRPARTEPDRSFLGSQTILLGREDGGQRTARCMITIASLEVIGALL